MADVNDLMSQYVNAANVTASKQDSVASATATKQAALGGMPSSDALYRISVGRSTGAGAATATGLDADLRSLSVNQLRDKYGFDEANALLGASVQANQAVIDDQGQARTGLAAIGDTAIGVGTGLAASLASIGALGAGMLNPQLGVGVAQGMQRANEAVQGLQSDALQGRRRVNAAQNALDARDTTAQFEAEKDSDGELLASLRRIGRDVQNTIGNAADSSMLLTDGVAQGVGSLLAAGPVSRGLAAFGVARNAAVPAAIGLMEGGGAYQQTAAQVAGMSFEQLAQTSPDFNALVASGLSQEEARTRIASNAGLQAAATQAPLAAAAGTLVSRFEGAPLRVPSLGSAAGNLLRETVEEGLQSGSGQLAQNAAIRSNADSTQVLSEGVGEQVGLGALYGLGSAGVVQAPGSVGAATRAVVQAAVSPLQRRAALNQEANQQASPVADRVVTQAAQEILPQAETVVPAMQQAIAEADTTPEAKAEASTYVDDLVGLFQSTGQMVLDSRPDIDPNLAPVLQQAGNMVEVIQNLATVSKMESVPEDLRLHAAALMTQFLQGMQAAASSEPEALQALPAEHQANVYLNELRSLAQVIEQSPSLQQAQAQLQRLAETANERGLIQPVTEESLATPEGQRNVANLITTAELAPEKADPQAIDQVLAHLDTGRLQLSPVQVASLRSVKALLDAAIQAQAERERLGLRPIDVVAGQVTTDKTGADGKQSARQHVNGIRAAYRAGDRDLAGARLADFLKFAQHMQNKVAALNTAVTAGKFGKQNGVGYEALHPTTREWYSVPDGEQGLGITPSQAKSVEFAQRLGVEAETLAAIANGLVDAYPDLNLSHVQPVSLAPVLKSGTAQEVVKQFAQVQPASPTLDSAAPAGTRPTPEVKKTAVSPSETKAKDAEPVKVTQAEGTEQPAAQATPVQQPVTTSAPVAPSGSDTPATTEVPSQEESTSSAPSTVERKGLAAVYPNLVGAVSRTADGLRNWFLTSFRLPEIERSRTGVGRDDTLPLAAVREALASDEAFQAFLGSDGQLFHDYDTKLAKAYGQYLKVADSVAQVLRTNLAEFLDKGSNRSKLLAGEANRWRNGKVLNLVETNEQGELVYNERLLQNAVLAGMQWLLTANDTATKLEREDVATLLGVSPEEVITTQIDDLDRGMGTIEAQQALATKIQAYWGVTPDRAAADGYAKGIPLAMAGEVLRALEQTQGLTVQKLTFNTPGMATPKTIDRLIPRDFSNSPMRAFPGAIDHAVLIEPEEIRYFGDARPPVAKLQMNNPLVENTREQRAAIKANQDTPYFAHLPMVNLYAGLGRDNVLALFGEGDLSDRVLNPNHSKTLEGRNRSILSAFDALGSLVLELQSRAAKAGVEMDQLPIHYAFNMSRVGRLQMLGKFSPQASKLVREAILPTRSTLDLSQGKDRDLFYLGLAQALGEKVHKQPRAVSVQKVQAKLDRMTEAVELLRDWHGRGMNTTLDASAVTTLKAALGSDLSPVAVHALVEYARYLNADAAERTAFTTSLYVEADGVTNGPITAMALMSLGQFDQAWVQNIAKGGLFLQPQRTVNDYMSSDGSVDLYETATQGLRSHLAMLYNQLQGQRNAGPKQQMDSMLWLMDTFLPGLEITADGITLNRGLAKNPLTITIYGSGANGIAAKVVSAITDEIYAAMSEAATRQSQDSKLSLAEAMFPNLPVESAQRKYDRFVRGVEMLSASVARKNKRGEWYLVEEEGTTRLGKIDPATFTLTSQQLGAMAQNLRTLYVDPLRDGINDTIGQTLNTATTMLRQATQAQSIFLQYALQDAVQKTLADKAKDPAWKKGDFLSQAEQRALLKQLDPLAPLVQTGSQSFFIAGSQSTELADTDSFGAALNDQFRSPAFVYAPMDAGVAGIPYLNIGTGDGLMIQLISTMRNGPKNFLPVFDGINYKLTTVEDDSRQANQAVWQTWQGNPLQAVYDSYARFMQQASFEMGPEQVKALASALGLGKDATADDIKTAMEGLQQRLQQGAKEAQARHNTLQRVAVSVDQMASAEAPYQQAGIDLSALPVEQQVAELNRLYREELAKLDDAKAEEVKEVEPSVTVLPERTVRKGLRAVFSPAQVSVLTESGATVLRGSAAQLQALAAGQGITLDMSDKDGVYHALANQIWLASDSNETLAHEVVHAATFATVARYYAGETIDTQAADAIRRLEALRDQFLELELDTASPELEAAVTTAQQAIAHPDPAVSLNEFMAYALTNDALVARLKVEPAPLLVRLTQKVVRLIKALVFGSRAPVGTVGKDVFSNLLFNTLIVAKTQPSQGEMAGDAMLYQSSAYGNDARLAALNDAFDKLVVQHIQQGDAIEQATRQSKVNVAQTQAIATANLAIAHGFPMTLQARTTFEMLVTALATEAQLDPNALSRVEDLYRHVTKTLTVEDFVDPNAVDPQAERYYAQQKFNTVMGNFGTQLDAQGRSSLLPMFLGLAMVDDGFRAVLRDMALPKSAPLTWSSLDEVLTNVGTTAMETLSQRVSGEGRSSEVLGAVDALMQRVLDTAQDRQSAIEQRMGQVGSMVDRANEVLVQKLDDLSQAVIAKADAVQASTNSKLVKAAADVAKLTAAIATEQGGARVAEGVMAAMNRVKIWRPLHDLINDLVGRTESNADIYDRIKLVRADVQQDRQQYREHLPTIIADKFSRKLTEREWASLHAGLGQTDLAVLYDSMNADEVRTLLTDPRTLSREIRRLEAALVQADAKAWGPVQSKAKQLANFMVTGEAGRNLLRNAYAVANLFGEQPGRTTTEAYQQQVDQLVTLYAVQALPVLVKEDLAVLAQSEVTGMDFALSYLTGQRVDEVARAKASPTAQVNAYKGYLPNEASSGVSLIVADDSEYAKLAERSFVRVGNYTGSSIEQGKPSKGYYYAPVSGRAPYNQGILQNVRMTAGGVDVSTGQTIGRMTAGRITDPVQVARLVKRMQTERATSEPLLPIYDQFGTVVAFERAIDPVQAARLQPDTHLAKAIGIWRGRQVEEAKAQVFNEALIDSLHAMYQADLQQSASNQDTYVDLFGQLDDPVLADAVKLITPATRDYIQSVFGPEFMVRKDMLNDAMGYRNASIGDAWTGNSRWSQKTQDTVKQLAIGVFGNTAYQKLLTAEKTLQNYVADARVVIVVKSVVVPLTNLIGNIYQLAGRGVPLAHIFRGLPKKTAEIDSYVKSRLRQVEAEAELRAVAGDVVAERKLKAEIQSITDAHKRLSIWPLIQAGEFSAISDAGISRDEILLSEGRLHAYMERLADKLPPGIRTAGRYALVTKDTALFQGLQKAVEYGDFLAKAILYDDLTKRQGRTKEAALARITEEFVNYDRLPGRFRGYLENTGLLWFYNFKIRAAKVALSMIRNNPVHALLAGLAPAPTWFGTVGTPLGDNFFSIGAEGRLTNSIGLGQAFHAPMLNPWINLAH